MTLRKALALLFAPITALFVMGVVVSILGPPVSDTEPRIIPGWLKVLAFVSGGVAGLMVFRLIVPMTLRKTLALLFAPITALFVMGVVVSILGPPVSDTEPRIIPGWLKVLAFVSGGVAGLMVFRLISGSHRPSHIAKTKSVARDVFIKVPVKIQCGCGQRYAFEVEPVAGRMPSAIQCPVCSADGTAVANQIIAETLAIREGRRS